MVFKVVLFQVPGYNVTISYCLLSMNQIPGKALCQITIIILNLFYPFIFTQNHMVAKSFLLFYSNKYFPINFNGK
jgi:hypothetical protein